MKCYNCKKQNEFDALYCMYCGARLKPNQSLINSALERNQESIALLYDMTKDTVYFTISSMVRDEDIIQDIFQDTYVKAINNLFQLKNPEAFRTWIKSIAHNMTIDYLRKKRVVVLQNTISDDSDEMIEFEDTSVENQPELLIDQKETAYLLKEILDSLSDDQRLTVSLFYYQQLSIKEISYELGINENTVKSRLNLARKNIKAKVLELEKNGTKLYGIAPFIFFLLLLRKGEDCYAAPIPQKEILSKIAQNTSVGNTSNHVGAKEAKAATNVEKGLKTASNMTTQNTAKIAVGKIIIGIAAISFLGGAGYGVVDGPLKNILHKEQNVEITTEENKTEVSTETEEIKKTGYDALQKEYKDIVNRYQQLLSDDFSPTQELYEKGYESMAEQLKKEGVYFTFVKHPDYDHDLLVVSEDTLYNTEDEYDDINFINDRFGEDNNIARSCIVYAIINDEPIMIKNTLTSDCLNYPIIYDDESGIFYVENGRNENGARALLSYKIDDGSFVADQIIPADELFMRKVTLLDFDLHFVSDGDYDADLEKYSDILDPEECDSSINFFFFEGARETPIFYYAQTSDDIPKLLIAYSVDNGIWGDKNIIYEYGKNGVPIDVYGDNSIDDSSNYEWERIYGTNDIIYADFEGLYECDDYYLRVSFYETQALICLISKTQEGNDRYNYYTIDSYDIRTYINNNQLSVPIENLNYMKLMIEDGNIILDKNNEKYIFERCKDSIDRFDDEIEYVLLNP